MNYTKHEKWYWHFKFLSKKRVGVGKCENRQLREFYKVWDTSKKAVDCVCTYDGKTYALINGKRKKLFLKDYDMPLDQNTESFFSNKREYRISWDSKDFVDERVLVSHDTFGKKEMKIKIVEVSDETPPSQWKFGDRVKVTKILVTIKHLETQQVEEGEFDIASIEKELTEKRHYSSTNRWVPTKEIKNGYVVNSRHTTLISDAAALEYIVLFLDNLNRK